MPSPKEIQFYDHKLRELKHPWSHKIKKWLEYDCIEIQSEISAICKPLKGYNTRTYSMLKNGFDWNCNCQGFKKRRDCSHVQALLLKFEMNGVAKRQGSLF